MSDFDTMMNRAIERAIIDEYAWGLRSLSDIAFHFGITKDKVEEMLLNFKNYNRKEDAP